MNGMRKIFGVLIAIVLSAFALPAAATYYYSLNMCAYGTGCTGPIAMTAVNNVSTGTVTSIIKNESPVNLTMKSFTLSVPAGSGLTILDATLPAGQSATKTISGGTLTVKSMSIGVAKGNTYSVILTVRTTACTAVSGNWTAQPWTGTSLNGSKFIMYPVSATHPATTFTPACSFPITTTVNPSNAGSLSCTPNPVPYNTSSSCMATASAGYDFSMFSGACSGSVSTCTVPGVTGPKSVSATFTPKNYPVTALVPGGHGVIAPLTPSVPFNTPAQLSVTPDSGYKVGSVTDNCGPPAGSLSGSTYTTGPVPVNGCAVTGSFTPNNYPVTTATTGSGTGTIIPLAPPTSLVPFGTQPTFTVTPAGNSSIDKVTDNCGLGGSLSGSTYTAAAVPLNGCAVTASFVANTLSITSQPTSVALNTDFDVAVGISPGPVSVVPNTSACGSASSTLKTSSSTSATFTFKIPLTPTITTCKIDFSASNYLPAPLSVTLPVFAAQAEADKCSSPDASSGIPGSTFDASTSCSTGSGINVSGFAAGFRSISKDLSCPALNFTLTNNICGSGPTQDASGKTIPTNAVSLVWDSSQLAAFTYTVTWLAEYVDSVTGLPTSQKTQYCTGTGATACDIKKPLKACISPLVALSSIPLGEPACIAEENWVSVPQTECGATLPIPSGTPACTRTTTIIIDVKDPPIIRG